MARFKSYLFSIALLVIITSCSTSTVEEDMKEYCQCVENINNRMERKACRVLAQEIADKFENDPEAAEYIEEHIYDCGRPGRRRMRIKLR